MPKAQENANASIPQESTHEFVKNLENKDKQINNLDNIVKGLKEQLTASNTKNEGCVNVTAKLKAVGDEKRALQIKHEKMCTDNKTLKNENEALKTELKSGCIALKTSQKEYKDATHRLEKKIEGFEEKLRELHEYKVVKQSEEKDLKSKIKKADLGPWI